jgi:hypothetical protein
MTGHDPGCVKTRESATILAYNLTRVMNIVGRQRLITAIGVA